MEAYYFRLKCEKSTCPVFGLFSCYKVVYYCRIITHQLYSFNDCRGILNKSLFKRFLSNVTWRPQRDPSLMSKLPFRKRANNHLGVFSDMALSPWTCQIFRLVFVAFACLPSQLNTNNNKCRKYIFLLTWHSISMA